MSVIDDITALLTPVLHTNTTKDITAAAVKAALISAFTDIVNDVDAKNAATLAAAEGIVGGGLLDPLTIEKFDFGPINLFDYTKVTPATFLFASGGTEAGHPGTNVSDYMIVKPGDSIIANHSEIFGGLSGNGPVFYDGDHNVIGSHANFDGVNPITVPSGAVYCRVNVLDSIKLNYMLVRGTVLPDHYIAFGATSGKRILATSSAREHALVPFAELTKVRMGQIGPGALNFHTIEGPGYIANKVFNLVTGEQTDSIWDTTDYFPVPPGGQITVTGWHDDYSGIGGYGITWWGADKEFVGGISFPFTDGQVISIPSNAYFGRMTINPGVANESVSRTFGIVAGNQPTFDHKFKAIPSLVKMHRPWTGKVWFAAGDSLVADPFAPWFRRVAEYHGCKYIRNHGVAGRFLYDMLKDGRTFPPSDSVLLPTSFFADIDCAFLLGGTNSIGFDHIALGAITDTPALSPSSTWYASLMYWTEYVINANPFMRVVLSTVNQRAGVSLADMNAYNQAVRDVANKYAVHVFELANHSQMSPLTYSAAYSTDSVHPLDAEKFTNVFGSNLAAFMHTVFPFDFVGDPLYGGNNYNR
jgi:hypothetical protein